MRRFAASSLKEFIDTPDDVLAGEAAEGKRRPSPDHVLRSARPLDVAGVQGLRSDVRPIRVKRTEQVEIRRGGSEHLLGQASVQMHEMCADRRLEIRPAAGEPSRGLVGVDGARERNRPLIVSAQAELGSKDAQSSVCDPPVRRELAARHA